MPNVILLSRCKKSTELKAYNFIIGQRTSVSWSPGGVAIWRKLKMQVGTASARWQWCWMIVITLSFTLPGTWCVMKGQENVNSALNQPVKVTPAQATCGFRSNDTVLSSKNEAILCAHGCAHNFSIAKRNIQFPVGVGQMGGHPCKLPQIRERATTNMTLCYSVRNDRLSSMASEYTYSVWIKPTDTHTEQ